jgi:hypothetical protein
MTAPALTAQPALQWGEVVDITITGARVSGPIHGDTCVLFGVGDDTISLSLGNPQATITRSTPADGVPKPGDIWRDQQGNTYAAMFAGSNRETVWLRPIDGGGAETWRAFHKGPSGPIRLVYRLSDDPHYLTETASAGDEKP